MKTFQETVKTNKAIEKRSKRYIRRERRGGKKVQLENNIKMPLLLITTHQPRAHTAIAKKQQPRRRSTTTTATVIVSQHTFTHILMVCKCRMAFGRSAEESFDFMRHFYAILPLNPFARSLARSLSLNWIGWHDFMPCITCDASTGGNT